jgi:ankyrin repeat protein
MSDRYFSWIDELFDAIEEEQDVKRVRELIMAGCNVNIQVEEGCTPLIAAVLIGNLEIVKLLVELGGADVNAEDKYSGSALYYAKYNNFQGIVEYLEPMTNQEVRNRVERFMNGQFYPQKKKTLKTNYNF